MPRDVLIVLLILILGCIGYTSPHVLLYASAIWATYIISKMACGKRRKRQEIMDTEEPEVLEQMRNPASGGEFNGFGTSANVSGGNGFRGNYWSVDAHATGRDALRADIARDRDDYQDEVRDDCQEEVTKLCDGDIITGGFGERGDGTVAQNDFTTVGKQEPEFDLQLYNGDKSFNELYVNMSYDGDNLIANRALYAGMQPQLSKVIRAGFNKYSMQQFEEPQLRRLAALPWWNSEHLDKEF